MDREISKDVITVHCDQCQNTFEVPLSEFKRSRPLRKPLPKNLVPTPGNLLNRQNDSAPKIKITREYENSREQYQSYSGSDGPLSPSSPTSPKSKGQVKNLLFQLETMSQRLLEAVDMQENSADDCRTTQARQVNTIKQVESSFNQRSKKSNGTCSSSYDLAKTRNQEFRNGMITENVNEDRARLTSPSFPERRISTSRSEGDETMNLSMFYGSSLYETDLQALKRENEALNDRCSNMEAELEDLTRSLFEEANRMVAEERKRHAEQEKRIAELETQLKQKISSTTVATSTDDLILISSQGRSISNFTKENIQSDVNRDQKKSSRISPTNVSVRQLKGKRNLNHATLEAEFAALQDLLIQDDT